MNSNKQAALAHFLGHSTLELDVLNAGEAQRTAREEHLNFSLVEEVGPAGGCAVVRLSGELDNLKAWFYANYAGGEEFEFYLA
jgi:hypothetical protein